MPNTQEAKPTQEFVTIEAIQNGVLILKNKALRKILLVSGINFDLKSAEEQALVVSAYQTLLNSLHFSLQFFVHSRRLNIEKYLAKLEGRKNQETNDLLQNQIDEYVKFVRSFVGQNPIMTKTFFVIVPFDPIVIPGAETAVGKKFFSFFGKKTDAAAASEAQTKKLRENIEQLEQRVAQVSSGLAQIGLRAVPLEDEELVDLFYNLYNPGIKEKA